MKLSEFDYQLPKNLIAQRPASPRDSSRLMIVERKNGKLYHCRFFNIDKFLTKGDVLVLNNSKVIPARLYGKKETGGRVEVLLLKRIGKSQWEALIKGERIKSSLRIIFEKNLTGQIIKRIGEGIYHIQFNFNDKKFKKILEQIGYPPTPPYIKTTSRTLKKYYQTVYAKYPGSVAAPTAGFHFTNRLLKKLKNKGIKIEFITLHVGLGTFQPVRCERIEDHKMHKEFAVLNKKTVKKLNQAKTKGQRIIACGTTVVRVLERAAKKEGEFYKVYPFKGWIKTFIYPGYKFKFIDAMITNFHLPKTTLLMLVSAFAGKKLIDKAYQEAISKKYRFYSFGDGMMII